MDARTNPYHDLISAREWCDRFQPRDLTHALDRVENAEMELAAARAALSEKVQAFRTHLSHFNERQIDEAEAVYRQLDLQRQHPQRAISYALEMQQPLYVIHYLHLIKKCALEGILNESVLLKAHREWSALNDVYNQTPLRLDIMLFLVSIGADILAPACVHLWETALTNKDFSVLALLRTQNDYAAFSHLVRTFIEQQKPMNVFRPLAMLYFTYHLTTERTENELDQLLTLGEYCCSNEPRYNEAAQMRAHYVFLLTQLMETHYQDNPAFYARLLTSLTIISPMDAAKTHLLLLRNTARYEEAKTYCLARMQANHDPFDHLPERIELAKLLIEEKVTLMEEMQQRRKLYDKEHLVQAYVYLQPYAKVELLVPHLLSECNLQLCTDKDDWDVPAKMYLAFFQVYLACQHDARQTAEARSMAEQMFGSENALKRFGTFAHTPSSEVIERPAKVFRPSQA